MRANENLHCFVPCSQIKIDAGQCGCYNRIRNMDLLDDKQIKEEDEQQEEDSEVSED